MQVKFLNSRREIMRGSYNGDGNETDHVNVNLLEKYGFLAFRSGVFRKFIVFVCLTVRIRKL